LPTRGSTDRSSGPCARQRAWGLSRLSTRPLPPRSTEAIREAATQARMCLCPSGSERVEWMSNISIYY